MLSVVARQDNVMKLAALFAFGLDINWQDPNNGQTALHRATDANQVLCMEFLIQNNAKLTIKDASGRTPMDLAQFKGNQ